MPHQGTSLCNRWRTLKASTTNQNTEFWNPVPTDVATTHFLYPKTQSGAENISELEEHGIFCEILSLRNVRTYIKSHLHGCPSIRQTTAIAINMYRG